MCSSSSLVEVPAIVKTYFRAEVFVIKFLFRVHRENDYMKLLAFPS